MIVVWAERLRQSCREKGVHRLAFRRWDGGDVYTMAGPDASTSNLASGSLRACGHPVNAPPADFGNEADEVRIAGPVQKATPLEPHLAGYALQNGEWVLQELQVIPVKKRLFSRAEGLLETDVIADRKVYVVGLGSGGSLPVLELAKAGVQDFILMDHDRLEVGNVARHQAGIEHVGRSKSKYMADAIRSKNPYAEVKTIEEKASWDNIDLVRECAREADLVLCCVDNRPGRLVVNKACVDEETPCIFAGMFSRAYGGQLLRVRPHISPCYQCFLMALPDDGGFPDQEISSAEQAEAIAYSDRPVAVEPGLSLDILPVSHMMTKLALQELLKDRPTTLRSLDEDLAAPWYIWLNRREEGTQYEDLEPLGCGVDGLRVLRWYGLPLEKKPGCPVCGDFGADLADRMGVEIDPEDVDKFRGSSEETCT